MVTGVNSSAGRAARNHARAQVRCSINPLAVGLASISGNASSLGISPSLRTPACAPTCLQLLVLLTQPGHLCPCFQKLHLHSCQPCQLALGCSQPCLELALLFCTQGQWLPASGNVSLRRAASCACCLSRRCCRRLPLPRPPCCCRPQMPLAFAVRGALCRWLLHRCNKPSCRHRAVLLAAQGALQMQKPAPAALAACAAVAQAIFSFRGGSCSCQGLQLCKLALGGQGCWRR